MKLATAYLLLIALCLFLFGPPPATYMARAADGRVITEGTNKVLAIGIDARDYDIVRFYLRGDGVVEFRADQILHKSQPLVVPPLSPVKSTERDALLAALAAQTNFSGANAQLAISNMVRLKVIESVDDAGKTRGP